MLALVFLTGCVTAPPGYVIRSSNFEPGAFSSPQDELRTVQTTIDGKSTHVAEAIRTKDGKSLIVRLIVDPPQPVGSPAKLRFRCRLSGGDTLTVQMFDVAVQDNRHLELRDLALGQWHSFDLDFTRDSRRNDGTRDTMAAGNKVDDVFFFVHGAGPDARLWVDDVTLYSPSKP